MGNPPTDENEEYKKKIKNLEKYIPLLKLLLDKFRDKPEEKTYKVKVFYDLMIAATTGSKPKTFNQVTLDKLKGVFELLATRYSSEYAATTNQRNQQVQVVDICNEPQPSTSRQSDHSFNQPRLPPIIDLEDDFEVGESSVHRNALENTASDNEIEVIEVRRDELSSVQTPFRSTRSRLDDDECWEIRQYEPLPVDEDETWVRCDDDGEIIDEIPTNERSNRRESVEQFSRSSSQERSNNRDKYDRPDKYRRDEHERSKYKHKKNKHKRDRPNNYNRAERSDRPKRPDRLDKYDRLERSDRSDKYNRAERFDRSDKYDWAERSDRPDKYNWAEKSDRLDKYGGFEKSDRLDRSDRYVSDRPKQPSPTPSRSVPNVVSLDRFEGSRRNRESQSTIVQNEISANHNIPVDWTSEQFRNIVAEVIDKIAKMKKNEQEEKSEILGQDSAKITQGSGKTEAVEKTPPTNPEEKKSVSEMMGMAECDKQEPVFDKPARLVMTGTNESVDMELCDISTPQQNVPPWVPAHLPMNQAPINRDFTNPIELPNQVGFNSGPLNNRSVPYPTVPSATWAGNLGPGVSIPQQLLGPFPLQSNLSLPPIPVVQSYAIHPGQQTQFIQPTARFPQFPSHPQLDPNIRRPREELHGPRPGTSSSNLKPKTSTFTKATLTYAEYKARKASSFAKDPRNTAPRSCDQKSTVLAPNVPLTDPRITSCDSSAASTRDPRTASLSSSIAPSRDPRIASRTAFATSAQDPRSDVKKDPRKFSEKMSSVAKLQKETQKVSANPRVKPPNGPKVECHKPKRDSKEKVNDKKKSKSKDSYKEKPMEKKKNAGEVYQSPLESLYGVVDTSRTGQGYGFQKFKIPKIKRTSSSKKRTSSPTPVQGRRKEDKEDEETKSINDFPFSEVPQPESENWYDDVPIPDTFTLSDLEVFPVQTEISSSGNDCLIDVTRAETPVLENVVENVSLQANKSMEPESSVSAKDEDQLQKPDDSTKSISFVDTKEDEDLRMEVDSAAQPVTSTSTKGVEKDTIEVRDILEKLTKNEISIEDAEKLMERFKVVSAKICDSSTDVGDSDNENVERKKKKKKKTSKRNVIESDSSDDDYLSKLSNKNITTKLSDSEKQKTDVDDCDQSGVPNNTEVSTNKSTENHIPEKSSNIGLDKHQAEKKEKKKRRKSRNDVEMLQDDLKEIFIGPQVLSLLEHPANRTKYNPSKSMVITSDDSDELRKNRQNQKKTIPSDQPQPVEPSNGDLLKTMFDVRVNLKRLPAQTSTEKDNSYFENEKQGQNPCTNMEPSWSLSDSILRPSSPKVNQNTDSNEVSTSVQDQQKVVDKSAIESNSEDPNIASTMETSAIIESSATTETSVTEETSVSMGGQKNAMDRKKKKSSGSQNGVYSKSSKKKAEKPPPVNTTAEVQKETGKTQTITSKQLLEYVWVDQNRIRCFCCNYIGKNIVHHYAVQHPNEEVMISRLSTEQAEKAIRQTQQRMGSHEMPFEIIMKFNCRFCTFSMTSALPATVLGTFYEHYTSHTGEYRYKCRFCPYRAQVAGTVKNHFYKTCKKKTSVNVNDAVVDEMMPMQGVTLFGYICSMCNFVQLNRSNVEIHAKKWHKNAEVIQIDMSDYIKEETARDSESDEEINSVNRIINLIPIVKQEILEDSVTEDILPEKEIVCSVNIKTEDVEVGEEETVAESDPLNGIGDVIKEECFDEDMDIENDSLIDQEMGANVNPNSSEENFDQDFAAENISLEVEQPDINANLHISENSWGLRIEAVRSLQNVATDADSRDLSETMENNNIGVSVSSQLKRSALPICAQILPKIEESASLRLDESAKQVITALTPPPTPMPDQIRANTDALDGLVHCNYVCKYCRYRGACRSYVEAHQQTEHPGMEVDVLTVDVPVAMPPPGPTYREKWVIPYRCTSDCEKTFFIPKSFETHLNLCHKDLNVYPCTDCNESFITSTDLLKHYEVVHNISQYQCLYCMFGTLHVENMLIHLSKNHFCKHPIILDRSFPPNPVRSMRSIDQLILRNLESFSIKIPLPMNLSNHDRQVRSPNIQHRSASDGDEEYINTNLLDETGKRILLKGATQHSPVSEPHHRASKRKINVDLNTDEIRPKILRTV